MSNFVFVSNHPCSGLILAASRKLGPRSFPKQLIQCLLGMEMLKCAMSTSKMFQKVSL
jgi:hypothetical protein